jgi:uncharacterized spore protein YtfJ
MTMLNDVQREIERQAGGAAEQVLDRLAQRIGGRASAEAVFGAPVERGDVTVIPVAKVRWGFGGGSGFGRSPEGQEMGQGSGGGGGVSAVPLGYIELRAGHAAFKPIKDPAILWAIPPVILAAALAASMVLGGVRRLVRG